MSKKIGFLGDQIHPMQFRILCLALFFLFSGISGRSQTRLSLLTCGPGDQMYALFGHTAIRVQDSLRGTDHVFNFGVFDFDTPNFTWKFMRGTLMYKLDIQEFQGFLPEYQYEGRSVIEQELLLDEADEAAIIAFLAENYQSDKRYYRYDFFFDNCSTRTRDVFEKVLKDRLKYRFPESESLPTFRDMIDPFIGHDSWLDFGIDILLGAPTDWTADERGQMFLPAFLSSNLAYGVVDETRPLLSPPVTFLEPALGNGTGAMVKPAWVFWLLLPFFALMWAYLPKIRQVLILDAVFWIFYGLVGCLIAFMWFGTSHLATNSNWNLLWLNPLQFAVGISLLLRPRAKWLPLFGWFQLLSLLAYLIAWQATSLEMHFASIPLIILLVLQSLRLVDFKIKRPKNPDFLK
jgi:hypothetical protein